MINIISKVINRNRMMNVRIKNKNALGDLNERMREQKPFDADDFKADQLRTQEIINNMDNIMNDVFGDKSLLADKQVSIETSHGSNIVVRGNLDISLDFYGDDGHKSEDSCGIHIEGDLSIISILENTTEIEKKLIKPLDDASDEIKSQMVSVANDALYQDMMVENAAKGLADLKEIDGYTESKIINNSKNILENAAEALYCQSSNLDRKRTSALLR